MAKWPQLRTTCLLAPLGINTGKRILNSAGILLINCVMSSLLSWMLFENGICANTNTPTRQSIRGAHFFRFTHAWHSIMAKLFQRLKEQGISYSPVATQRAIWLNTCHIIRFLNLQLIN